MRFSPRHVVSTSVRGAALLVCAGIALAACGSGSAAPPPASDSAKALLAKALANATAGGWVHETIHSIEPGHKLDMDNDIGTNSGRQVIVLDGAHATVILTNDEAFIKGDEKAIVHYFQLPTKTPTKWANRWIAIKATDGGFASVSSSVTLTGDFKQFSLPGPLTKGAVVTLDGQRVIPIRASEKSPSGKAVPVTIYVTASGTVLPVSFTVSTGSLTTSVDWSDWGKSVVLVAPSPTTPIASVVS